MLSVLRKYRVHQNGFCETLPDFVLEHLAYLRLELVLREGGTGKQHKRRRCEQGGPKACHTHPSKLLASVSLHTVTAKKLKID